MKSYWDIMEPEDARTLALSFFATLVLGCVFVGGFIKLAYHIDEKRAEERREAEDNAVDKVLATRAARQGRPYVPKTDAADAKKAFMDKEKGGDGAAASKLPQPAQKRHIPIDSQKALVETGRIQLAQDKPDKALVTYLTLLYAAAENRDGSSLPANLTECLRGAAECYRKLGQPENAVKFLQAERRVFEEVVVSAANAGKPPQDRKRGGILQSLLNPAAAAAAEEDLPQRCQTLTEVGDACMKLERYDVALAYRVKAAAVKQKVTGKPLDDRSPELIAMAAALAKVKEMGIDTGKVLKAATSGENAVHTDDPIIQRVLQQQKSLADLGRRTAVETTDKKATDSSVMTSGSSAYAGPPTPSTSDEPSKGVEEIDTA